jgi:hypothetical protein
MHLTSICLALWSVAIASRIMWFMVPLGTIANLTLNLWRVRIFAFVLPELLTNALQVKIIVPIVCSIVFVTCFPIYIWIFGPEIYKSSENIQTWANIGFTTWISVYTISDLIAAAISLRKVFEVVVNGKEKYARECKILLLIMILTDAYCVVDMCRLATNSGFPYPRDLISPLFSLTMLHVSVTYLYMVAIVKYIADRRKSVISTVPTKAMQSHASKSKDENQTIAVTTESSP